MSLTNLLRSARALTPWLSLAAPFVLFGSMIALETMLPDLFCMPVNSGGKETICGRDYSHPGINLLRFLGVCVWLLLLITAGAEVFRRRASRAALVAWSVSVLLFVSLIVIGLTLPVECSL